jgi:transposase
VIKAVEQLDLGSFYAAYRADGHGRAAHDPRMMLTLLAYAYCVGERSSRGIERRCREDVTFRVVCANRFSTTRQSRVFGFATRRPWRSCSARCSASVPRRGWCGSG